MSQLDLFDAQPPRDPELTEALRTVAYGYVGDTGIKHTIPYNAACLFAKLVEMPQPFSTDNLRGRKDDIEHLRKAGLATISYLPKKMARAHFKRARVIEMAEQYVRWTEQWCS